MASNISLGKIQAEEAAIAVRHAIAQVDAARRLRGALELAASKDTDAMQALRLAICDFTCAHRGEGLAPESVLIALKQMVDDRAMPPFPTRESNWNGWTLRQRVSTWCINAYFNDAGACT